MSDYTYTDPEGDRFAIQPSIDPDNVFVCITEKGGLETAAHIAKADAPKVALELLNVAASDWSTQPVELVAIAASLSRYVKSNDPQVKLQERRAAVLATLLPEAAAANNLPHPHELSTLDDRAIDRIIELEDKAAQS